MNRKQLLMIVLAIAIVGAAFSALFAQQEREQQRVTLCHRTPDGTANTLIVPSSAASAHFAHGDTAGACPASTPGQ